MIDGWKFPFCYHAIQTHFVDVDLNFGRYGFIQKFVAILEVLHPPETLVALDVKLTTEF